MKKKQLLYIMLSMISMSLYSQKFSREAVYLPTEIEKVIRLSQQQKEALENARALRLKNAVPNDPINFLANKDYFNSLLTILNHKQETVLFGAMIAPSTIENKRNRVLRTLSYLPKQHKQSLIPHLDQLHRELFISKLKYRYNPEQKTLAIDSIKLAKKQLLEKELLLHQELKKDYKTFTNSCTNMDKQFADLYTEYLYDLKFRHFKKAQKLSNTPLFAAFVKQVSHCHVAQRLAAAHQTNPNLDSISKLGITYKFIAFAKNKFKDQCTHKQPLSFEATDAELSRLLKTAYLVSSRQNSTFIRKADSLQIPKEKIAQVVAAMVARNKELVAYQQWKEAQTYVSYELNEETTWAKKLPKIKKDFAEKVSQILTLQEYGQLVGAAVVKSAVNKTDKEYKNLGDLSALDKQDRIKIRNLIYTYHFRKNVTKLYYGFDAKLLSQKRATLTYRFEKELRKLAKDYGLDVSEKINTMTFQWN